MSRRIVLAAFAAAFVSVAAWGGAWACTGQSEILILPTVVNAGQPVNVVESTYGGGFAPANVEIRWNAPAGVELGRIALPESTRLNAPIAVPNVPPGVYFVLAISGDRIARAPVKVVAGSSSGSSAVSGDLWSSLKSTSIDTTGPGPSASSGSTPGLAAGIGLLAVGATGLAGATMVAVRRRRTKAPHN